MECKAGSGFIVRVVEGFGAYGASRVYTVCGASGLGLMGLRGFL